jgi:hypothetical protein
MGRDFHSGHTSKERRLPTIPIRRALRTQPGHLAGTSLLQFGEDKFVATHEHRFGFICHSVTGLVVGALSGAFLQDAAVNIVTSRGSHNPSIPAKIFVIHVLGGAVAGVILTWRSAS